ncbi:MAG: ATP-binding protein [Acidobacteriota bacterium]
MRTLFLAIKIGLLFALVMALVLSGVLFLFFHVFGHDPHDLHGAMARVQAQAGVETAHAIEALLDRGRGLDGEEIAIVLTRRGHRLHREDSGQYQRPSFLEVDGRRCLLVGDGGGQILIPIDRAGRTVAHVAVAAGPSPQMLHRAFRRGLLNISLASLIGIAAVAIYLSSPLRRMRRSMDRIAAGDLDHQVTVRGRDEVAAMGDSFNAMADRIRQMVRGQKEMLAGVSHELRSPLARMKVALELLREEAPSERLEDLEAEVDAINDLVGEVLLASRFDLDAVPLETQRLELGPAVEGAWHEAAMGAEFELVLDLAAEAMAVSGDAALVTRVLRNLFQNARRYAGGGAVVVSSRLWQGRVELLVSDHGPGVPADQRQRLFEPFFRGDRSRRPRSGAVGLGLMIVRRAVEAHGGRVRAEESAAGGLAISFDLPAPTAAGESVR